MSSEKINLQEIEQLLKIVEHYGLEELTVRQDDLTVTIKGKDAAVPVVQADPAQPATPQAAPRPARRAPKAPRPAAQPERSDLIRLLSPMTGVFYRSPSPDSPPFVEVGDEVEEGQTIGLIEAMKVFSEVPAEHAGRVVELAASNGKLVQADEPLLILEPLEGAS